MSKKGNKWSQRFFWNIEKQTVWQERSIQQLLFDYHTCEFCLQTEELRPPQTRKYCCGNIVSVWVHTKRLLLPITKKCLWLFPERFCFRNKWFIVCAPRKQCHCILGSRELLFLNCACARAWGQLLSMKLSWIVRQENIVSRSFARSRNMVGNSFSATMIPRLWGPLKLCFDSGREWSKLEIIKISLLELVFCCETNGTPPECRYLNQKRKRDISIQKQSFGNRFFRSRLFKMITQICSFRFGGVAHN